MEIILGMAVHKIWAEKLINELAGEVLNNIRTEKYDKDSVFTSEMYKVFYKLYSKLTEKEIDELLEQKGVQGFLLKKSKQILQKEYPQLKMMEETFCSGYEEGIITVRFETKQMSLQYCKIISMCQLEAFVVSAIRKGSKLSTAVKVNDIELEKLLMKDVIEEINKKYPNHIPALRIQYNPEANGIEIKGELIINN